MSLAAAIHVRDRSWMDHAACVGVDPDLFFPVRGEAQREAKAVCARCPVIEECLEYALAVPERFGIWGGTNERERRSIRRARRGVPTCIEAGCTWVSHMRGRCRPHYRRWLRSERRAS